MNTRAWHRCADVLQRVEWAEPLRRRLDRSKGR